MASRFDELVAEAERAPITGWDFSWLDGRATEERPPWAYSARVAEFAGASERMLDVQCGGGELLAGLPVHPRLLVATEAHPPNLAVAARRLRPRGAYAVAAPDNRDALPFRDVSFDLVTSRHPIETWWSEIARVLRPGGTFLSQQVGPRSMRELSEALLGPLPWASRREPDDAARGAEQAGLVVDDLRTARLRATFDDIGAVIYFLRLVVWTVPDFSVDRFRAQLAELHDRIEREGSFVAHSTRFLIRAHKPGGGPKRTVSTATARRSGSRRSG
jgi:SAM-dependent methyltransferase